jgi:Lon protease-like protein
LNLASNLPSAVCILHAEMSEFLPLFPLPTTVLFPNVFLPLHVFEPRYRDLMADALAG